MPWFVGSKSQTCANSIRTQTLPIRGNMGETVREPQVSAGEALLALAGTLPFLYLASHGLVIAILACALFLQGMSLNAVGVPSISAAYSSVKREDLPMATNTLNTVMRIGGPTLTMICATFLVEIRGCAQQ